jgi:hypothetical protein
VTTDLRTRLTQATAARDAFVAAAAGMSDEAAVSALRGIAAALVAEQVPLTLPLTSARLDAVLDRPPRVGGGTVAERRRAARALVRDAATVRPAVGNLQRLRSVLTGHGFDPPDLDLRQLAPDQPVNDPWVGQADPRRSSDPHGVVGGGRVSMVTMDARLGADDPSSPTAGLVLDEWSETVPAPVVTTALAVHADRPSNEAPQAVLLAVPPDPGAGWSQDALEAVLLEAFDLARVRAVDLPALPALGQVVPMLHLPMAGMSFNRDLEFRDFIGRHP